MAKKNNIKVSGYAQKVFFNNNIEYRDFSDNLVGLQLTSVNENSQFTMGNFTITTNIDPKVNKVFNTGVISDFYTLESIGNVNTGSTIFIDDSTKITKTNIDITKPLGYVYFGSFSEFLRVSTEDIIKKWPASLYITNVIGSITGNNISNYVYSSSNNTSTITLSTNYFSNPYSIIYSKDASLLVDPELLSSIRNFTVNYGSYVIDNNNEEYVIKSITASTRQTNDSISLVVNGNPFSEITGTTGSIKFHIKPNETKREEFFSNLNEFQSNLLNRLSYPEYTSNFNYEYITDQGTLIYDSKYFNWPVISGDNYNLDVFTTSYETFYGDLSSFINDFDLKQTNILNRKLIAEAIISFDTVPSCGGDDLTNNGQKATKLLNIYGRSFDEYKKWVDTVKFAHVVTYNKRNNLPDPLVKELSYMLGLEKLNFLPEVDFSKLMLPSNGQGSYSGSSRQMTLKEVDVELYRRIILNIAWLWKSKGSRKAIEFLFRLIGAPEALVNFDEYIYVADKPINVEDVKRLLYLFTGDADLTNPKLNLPFDEYGYPLPPKNGVVDNVYYQSNGGWYRETGGSATTKDVYVGNNPHIGPYDGGNSYLDYFTNTVYIPNFNNGIISFTGTTYILENLFLNYNKGLVDGLDDNYTFYGKPYTLKNVYIKEDFLKINKSLAVSPEISGYTSQLKLNAEKATEEYNKWINLIKENPYKAYDPEWEYVKSNKEAADANYFSQESILDPNVIDKHIEICLDKIEVVDENICLDYTFENGRLVKDGPYLVFYDEFDNKTSEIPVECCYSNGGKIITVTDTKGFNYQYCVLTNPCDGFKVSSIKDGIVYWEIKDSTIPRIDSTNSTNTFVEVCPECCAYNNYEYGEINLNASNNDFFGNQTSTTTNIVFGCKSSKPTYITARFDVEDNNPYGSFDSNTKKISSEPTDCNITRQSAGYKINDLSNQTSASQYATNQSYGNQVANPTCDSLITDINNKTGVVTLYNNTQALNIGSSQYSNCCKAKGFEIRCYDVPYYVKHNVYKWVDCNSVSSSGVTASFDTDVYVQYGKKAVTLKSNYNFKCVDPRIADLTDNSVKIIMGVNEWNGITLDKELSENETCDFEINVNFLLKYDADSLLNCGSVKKTCTPSFEMYKNTISEAGGSCFKNFIVFVNDESDVAKLKYNTSIKDYNNIFTNNDEYSSLLDLNVQNTYDGPEFKQGWYDVKQLEPSENKECCEAYGGNVITKAEWRTIYENKNDVARYIVDIIFKNYLTYKNALYTLYESYENTIGELKKTRGYDDSLTFDSYGKIGEYKFKHNELTGRNSWKDQVKLITCNFDIQDTCPLTNIDWNKVVSTNNVCSIITPVSCDIYGTLQINYWYLIGQLQQAYDITKQCIDDKNNLLVDKAKAESDYNSLIREKLLLETDYITKQTEYNNQKQICSEDITKLQDEITNLEGQYVINNCGVSTYNITNIGNNSAVNNTINLSFDDGFNIDDVEVVVNFGMTDPCATAPIGCPYSFLRDADGIITINGANSSYSCGCKGYTEEGNPNSISLEISNLGFCKGNSNYCSCCKVSDIVEDLYVTTNKTTDPTLCSKLKNDINTKKIELEQKVINCKKIDTDFILVTEEYLSKLQIINDKLNELNITINGYNEKLDTDYNCCDDQLKKLKSFIDESIKDKETIKKYSNECLDAWHDGRMKTYSDFNSQNNIGGNIFNLIDDAKVYLTLEVMDKTNDPSISNTTTILNTDITKLINESYWVFSGVNEYTGVVIEGDNDVTVKQVKKSLLDEIKNKYGNQYGTLNTFEPKWQHLKLPISNTLVNLYKGREFKFGIVVDNYECDVCLKIDTIQINRNCNNTKNYINTETCPTFDLTCVKDNKRSWLFKDNGIQVIKNNTLETSINIIDTENRVWSDLEYRYTHYNVNHDDLIVNSKSTIFRIDPAKAIECDVYDFFRSISGCSYNGYHCENTMVEVTCGSETTLECICVDSLINIDPLNYLDKPLSEMTTKESIDEMISSNLIDVKSRQVLNGYPMLELFVWMYLNPDNCGGISGQLNYSNLFQFMDLVGDYWMDLIEQVVPATTIWDGCENSGKIYRNTIFDRDKYSYKRYRLLSEYVDGTCRVEKTTDDVIGFTEAYYETETICNTKNGVCDGVYDFYMDNNGVVHKIEKEIKINYTYSNIVFIQYTNDSNEYESTINIDDYEETILFNRNCYPEINCGDQKQFEDNDYFEFMDGEPYYFMD